MQDKENSQEYVNNEQQESENERKKILIIAFCLLVIIICSFYFYTQTSLKKTEAPLKMQTNFNQENGDNKENKDWQVPKKEIVVYITGGVANPGLYHLPSKSRVFDLVEKAGGLLPTVESNKVNLAKMLKDGMHIDIPVKADVVSGNDLAPSKKETNVSEQSFNNGKININTGTQKDLETLPGIGQDRAKKIIEYRESKGSFNDLEELKQIKGIGNAVFEKIKDKITI